MHDFLEKFYALKFELRLEIFFFLKQSNANSNK